MRTSIDTQKDLRKGACDETAPLAPGRGRRSFSRIQRARELACAHAENERLRAELNDRTTALSHAQLRAQEIDHRAKNAFAVAAGMLRAQGRASSEEIATALGAAAGRLTALAMAHTGFYKAALGQPFALHTHLDQLCRALDVGHAKVRVLFVGDHITCSAESGSVIGLIVSEAVTNALKHGFDSEDTGRVQVALTRTATEGLTVVVSDDGKGGCDHGLGLGGRLMNGFASQLGGNIQAAGSPTRGHALTLIIPHII
ncbi:MAG: sensor histidine kinase [Rhizorhabdus sp.]